MKGAMGIRGKRAAARALMGLAALAACGSLWAADIVDASGRVQYVINLRPDADAGEARAPAAGDHMPSWQKPQTRNLVHRLEKQFGIQAIGMTSWTVKSMFAYLTPQQASALAHDPRITGVRKAQSVSYASAPAWQDGPAVTSQANPMPAPSSTVTPWGVQAVGGGAGISVPADVLVYVVDAGVDSSHPDLNVVSAVNAISDTLPTRGCYGHATHVAGIIGGRGTHVFGVLPGIALISVSINSLSSSDSQGPCATEDGTISEANLEMGLDRVKSDVIGHPNNNKPAVVNLSIARHTTGGTNIFAPTGDPNQPSVGDIMIDLANAQVTPDGNYPGALVVQSAGNLGVDACNMAFNGASANDGIMVVGGIDRFGQPATAPTFGFENGGFAPYAAVAGNEPGGTDFGSCVDIWAPSRAVFSTWLNGQYAFLSGTSMAAPHITAVAAYLLSANSWIGNPQDLEQLVRANQVTLSGAVDPSGNSLSIAMGTLFGGASVTALPSPAIGVYTGGDLSNQQQYGGNPLIFDDYSGILQYGFYGVNSCTLNGNTVIAQAVPVQVAPLRVPPTGHTWTLACGTQSASVDVYPAPTATLTTSGCSTDPTYPQCDSDQAFQIGFSSTNASTCDLITTNTTNQTQSQTTTLQTPYTSHQYTYPTVGLISAPGTYVVIARCYSPYLSSKSNDSVPVNVTVHPSTTIDSGPGGTGTTATFSFHSNVAGASFTCTLDGAQTSCTSPVTYTGLSAGSHVFQVAAAAVGMGTDQTPAQAVWTVGAATSVALSATPNPAYAGQSVTLTANVTGGTGTVTFYDGNFGISGCVGVAVTNATASCSVSSLSVGTHALSATYSGSTSNTVNETIQNNLATPAVSLSASKNPVAAGAALTLTTTVTAGATGTVAFYDGSTGIASCTAVPLASGSATCTVSNLTVGTHSLTARYSGDSAYAAATSGALSETVQNLVTPSVTLNASASQVSVGTPVTLTVQVSAGATGSVTFMDGVGPIDWCVNRPLSNQVATCTIPNLSSGTHAFSAQYSGDSSFAPATSAPTVATVQGTHLPVELFFNQ